MLYHIDCLEPAVEDFRKALANAISMAITKSVYDIGLAVRTEDDMDGPISNTLGENSVKILKRPGETIISSSVRLHMLAGQTQPSFDKGILIAMCISPERIRDLMSGGNVVDIVYVPCSREGLSEFLEAYQSTEI